MSDKKLIIPPWKEALIVSGIVAIGSSLLVVFEVKPYLTRTVDPWFLALLSVFIFLANCKSYVITENGIICRFFLVPYRSLKWTDISDAVFINEWRDLGQINKENILLITLKPCRPYDTQLYSISSYRFHFFTRSILIHLPKEKVDVIVQSFHNCLDSTQFRDTRI